MFQRQKTWAKKIGSDQKSWTDPRDLIEQLNIQTLEGRRKGRKIIYASTDIKNPSVRLQNNNLKLFENMSYKLFLLYDILKTFNYGYVRKALRHAVLSLFENYW